MAACVLVCVYTMTIIRMNTTQRDTYKHEACTAIGWPTQHHQQHSKPKPSGTRTNNNMSVPTGGAHHTHNAHTIFGIYSTATMEQPVWRAPNTHHSIFAHPQQPAQSRHRFALGHQQITPTCVRCVLNNATHTNGTPTRAENINNTK